MLQFSKAAFASPFFMPLNKRSYAVLTRAVLPLHCRMISPLHEGR